MSETADPNLVIGAPEPKRPRHGLVVAGVCALVLVVVLGVGAVFAYQRLTTTGAASPTSAVTELLDGLADQNLRDVGRYLSPAELDELEPVVDATRDYAAQQPDASQLQQDAADLLGAFSVELSDVETTEEPIGTGLTKVSLESANIAVDVDSAELTSRAKTLRDDYASYLRANGHDDDAESLGKEVTDARIDKLVRRLESSTTFPYHTTLDDLRREMDAADGLYLVTTEEDGRWYVSPSMTAGEYAFEDQQKGDAGLTRGAMPSGDGAAYSSPEAATTGLLQALTTFSKDGDLRTLADSLPAAERRFVDVYAIPLSDYDPQSVAGSGDVLTLDKDDVSVAADKDDWARVRLDDVQLTDTKDHSVVRVYDGTCVASSEQGSSDDECLQDVLENAIGSIPSEYMTGELSTLPGALRDLVEGFPYDQVGVVALRQDGSWHVGAVPTVGDWYGLLLPSLEKLTDSVDALAS